jgi:hypothetical protein
MFKKMIAAGVMAAVMAAPAAEANSFANVNMRLGSAIHYANTFVVRERTAATPGHGFTWRNSVNDRPASLGWTADGSGGYTGLRWTTFHRGGGPVAIARGGVYLRLCWGGAENPPVCDGSQMRWFTVGRVTLTFAGANNHDRWEAVKIRTRLGWQWRSLIGRRPDSHVFKPDATIYSFLAGKAPAGVPAFFPCGTIPARAFDEYLSGGWPYPYVHTNPETGACSGVR